MKKIKLTIATRLTQIMSYKITSIPYIGLMSQLNEKEVMVHQARIDNTEPEKTKRLLLASSGYLYKKYFKK